MKKILAILVCVMFIATGFFLLSGDEGSELVRSEDVDEWAAALLSAESTPSNRTDTVVHIDGDPQDIVMAYPLAVPFSVDPRNGDTIPLVAGPASEKPVSRFITSSECEVISLEADDPAASSVAFGETLWESAEAAVVVTTYRDAVLAAPLAAYVQAPMFYHDVNSSSGLKASLKGLGVKRVLSIQERTVKGFRQLVLPSEEVQEFYLRVLTANGDGSSYVVVTNPDDIVDYPVTGGSNMPLSGLSCLAAELAAHRKAVITTGHGYDEWDKNYGDGFTFMGVPYGTALNTSERIMVSIDDALKLLEAWKFNATHLAMVGGPITLPFHYADMMAYVEERQYTPSDYEYANLDDDPYQELAVGRIMGQNIWAAATTVANAICFDKVADFAYERDDSADMYDTVSEDWKENAMVMVGTTKIGPFPGILTPTLGNQSKTLSEAGYTVTPLGYDLPAANAVREIIDEMNYNVYYGHGDVDCWYSNVADPVDSSTINAADLKPGFAIAMACLTGLTDSFDYATSDFISMAFLYSGFPGYIGATRVAYGLYDYEVHDDGVMRGTGALYLVDIFSKRVCFEDEDMGTALMKSKNALIDKQGYGDTGDEFEGAITVNEYQLYGDPAWNPWVPDFDG